MKKIVKKRTHRFLSIFLALCLVLVSFPGYAAEIEIQSINENRDYTFDAESFFSSVSDISREDEIDISSVLPWDMSESSGSQKDYQKLFSQNGIYEFFPDADVTDEETAVDARFFIQTLPENWIGESYQLTGKEKLILLFINEGENDITVETQIGSFGISPVTVPAGTGFEKADMLTEDEILPSKNEETTKNSGSQTSSKEETTESETSIEELRPEGSSSDEPALQESATGDSVDDKPDTTTSGAADPSAEEPSLTESLPEETSSPFSIPDAVSPENTTAADSHNDTGTPVEEISKNGLSISALSIPTVGEGSERIRSESDRLDGKLMPSVHTEDGFSALAFITDFSKLVEAYSPQGPSYTLLLTHLLNYGDVEYYEEQSVLLREEDFDENGIYSLEPYIYTTSGLTAVIEETGLTVDKISFSQLSEHNYRLNSEISYQLSEGFKVQDESVSQDMQASVMRSSFSRVNGFPKIISGNAVSVKAPVGGTLTFTRNPENYEESGDSVNCIDLSEADTVYLYSDTSDEQSSIIIDDTVQGLNLMLGTSDGSDHLSLVLDSSGTDNAAIAVMPEADITITLVGETKLYGGNRRAGLELMTSESKEENEGYQAATVEITGDGTLSSTGGQFGDGDKAKQGAAGIGGAYNASNGNLTISGGTITATGGAGGAGIGGGDGSNNSGGSYKVHDRSGGTILITGGEVTARGGNNAAGIGGGNHGDGSRATDGSITIAGDAVIHAYGGGGGAGIGSGLGSSKTDNGKKGPGYYYGGIISISENCKINAYGGGNAAGIGGGMYGDSGDVTISGGTVKAYGSTSDSALYQGGAGIGGGYEGHGNITITGGSVYAEAKDNKTITNMAAGIGSGSTPNTRSDRGTNGEKARGQDAYLDQTSVSILGGTVEATGGSRGGAGIGSGFGADICSVEISGGTITASGGSGTRTSLDGGAGIGSGCNNAGIKDEYSSETKTDISIDGGTIKATGGWGASGIGSGAENIRADVVSVTSAAEVTAYADGTKFAIDTYDRNDEAASFVGRDGSQILQGTFMDIREDVNYEGFKVSVYKNYDPVLREDTLIPGKAPETQVSLPNGYRSFARSTGVGSYLVKAEKQDFEPKWFVFDQTDAKETEPAGNGSQTYHYGTDQTALSDNYWLYLYQGGNVDEEEPPTEPAPTDPAPTDPAPTDPAPTDPAPTDPAPTDPAPTDPAPTDPVNPAPGPSGGGGSDGGSDTGANVTTQTTTTPSPTVTINPEDIPLASLPSAPEDAGLLTIDDGEIPLAALPKTGENRNLKELTGLLTGALMGLYFFFSKKKADS